MINTFCVLLKILSLPQYHKNILLYVIISMLCDFDFHIYIYSSSKFIFVCELEMKVHSFFSHMAIQLFQYHILQRMLYLSRSNQKRKYISYLNTV